MKTIHIIIFITAAATVLFTARETVAQSNQDIEIIMVKELGADCSSGDITGAHISPKGTIVEEDYPYLMNLNCLKDGNYFTSRGWNWDLKNINPKIPTHFDFRGSGSGINLMATYDNEGFLVESMLKITDTRIPPAIRRFISSGEFKGWVMVGNEKIVRDFDPYQTEYKIILSDGVTQQTLNFKDQGNRIAYIGN
jgi:hypothetical protein